MKRKLLFGIYAIAAMAVSAQSVEMKVSRPIEGLDKSEIKIEKKLQLKKEDCTRSLSNQKFEVKELEGRTILPFAKSVALRANGVEAFYMLPVNDTFHFGMDKEWNIKYPNIVLPPAVDVIFENLSSPANADCTWSLQGNTPESLFGEDASKLFKVLPESNSYSTNWPISLMSEQYSWNLSPVVTVTSGGVSDSYFYSKGAVFNNKPIERKSINILAGSYNELTTSDPIMGSYYSGFSRKLQSGETESKNFGSGYMNSKGEECTGIISVYKKPASPLVIEGVSIHAIANKENDQNAVSTDDLTLQVYKVDGTTITNEVLAKAECTSVEYDSEIGAYYITFQFVKDEGLLGTQPMPFALDQNAAIEIDGFNKCDITVLVTENENTIFGHAYGVYPSGLDYVSYEWFDESAAGYTYNIADFAMNLNAAYVALTSGGEEYSLTAPTIGGKATDDGGYNFFAMYSTFPYIDPNTQEQYVQIVDAPEWVEVGIDNSLWGSEKEDYNCYFGFNVTCDPLTSGSGRKGDIVFETEGGIQTKVHITQGTPSGVETIETSPINAIPNGDNFELSYPEGTNTVTLMNVAGQILATYELPTGGKFTMPASNLSKGIYLMKFNGNETIKIIK